MQFIPLESNGEDFFFPTPAEARWRFSLEGGTFLLSSTTMSSEPNAEQFVPDMSIPSIDMPAMPAMPEGMPDVGGHNFSDLRCRTRASDERSSV